MNPGPRVKLAPAPGPAFECTPSARIAGCSLTYFQFIYGGEFAFHITLGESFQEPSGPLSNPLRGSRKRGSGFENEAAPPPPKFQA